MDIPDRDKTDKKSDSVNWNRYLYFILVLLFSLASRRTSLKRVARSHQASDSSKIYIQNTMTWPFLFNGYTAQEPPKTKYLTWSTYRSIQYILISYTKLNCYICCWDHFYSPHGVQSSSNPLYPNSYRNRVWLESKDQGNVMWYGFWNWIFEIARTLVRDSCGITMIMKPDKRLCWNTNT